MPPKILYIDDRLELPDRTDELLAKAGYALVHTADPDEALRIVCEDGPALVLMEVLLPNCDGFDLLRRLDAASTAPPLPIVVVTRGERTPKLYGQALEMGVRDFLCKPVVGAEILEAVLAFAPSDENERAATIKSFEGRLVEQPLPGLLGRLHRAGASGVLRVRHEREARAVEFRNGSPVEIEKHRNIESVADYLHRTGLIDDERYAMLVDQLMARLGGPREILMGMQALTEAQLTMANREQALGVFLEMFGWPSGEFSFHADQRLERAETLELAAADPTKLLLAGLKRTSGAVIQAALEQHATLYASFHPSAFGRLDGIDLAPEKRPHLESLIGDRSVAEILAAKKLDARTLYGLHVLGAILFDEVPVLVLDEELKSEEPEAFEALPNEVVRIRRLPERRALPDSAAARSPAVSEPVSSIGPIASLLDGLIERLDARDDFALFGIDATTSDGQVRQAYDRLLALLRKEIASSPLEDAQTRTRELSARLEQAYQRVRTKDTRSAFAGLRKSKRPAPETRAMPEKLDERDVGARAVEAESWFRTGEGHMRHDEFAKAIEAFGMAVHLDPAQGDYAASLGYALYRSNPGNAIIRREALEHVAKGVKSAPDREKPLLFLSRIFRETGETAMAAKVLRRALKINPDSPVLVQEMCLIESGDPQARGNKLLGLFRRS